MPPIQSYRIWFTQRNGSTLLCKTLEQTGVAGKPGEYFNLMGASNLCEKYRVNNYEDLKRTLWDLGIENQVFGIKHSLYRNSLYRIADEISSLRNIREDHVDPEEIFADLFPNCKHIFLTRRNKAHRQFGWGRFSNYLQLPKGDGSIRIYTSKHQKIQFFRIYDRTLRNAEFIRNWRAGL